MSTILDFEKFKLTAEQLRDVKELIYEEVVKSPEYEILYTIYPGVVFGKEVGLIGKGSLVGVAQQGCDPTPQEYNIGLKKITWTPAGWEVYIAECFKDLEATAAAYSLKTGVNRPDFSDGDYINIVVDVLSESIRDFITRVVWFGDTTIADATLTKGVDKKYFNLFDGFFKQMDAQVTENAKQGVTIAENAGASYAEQELTVTKIQGYLSALVYNAPVQLRSRKDKFLLVTQSVYDAYEKSLSGLENTTLVRNLVNGIETLTFKGIPVIAMPKWDEIIATCFDNGTKLANPHRAVFTARDFLGIAVDDESSLADIDVWHDKDSRKVKLQAMGKLDAKVLNPAMFVLAE